MSEIQFFIRGLSLKGEQPPKYDQIMKENQMLKFY